MEETFMKGLEISILGPTRLENIFMLSIECFSSKEVEKGLNMAFPPKCSSQD
jgi:hypothetical protein